MKITNSDKSNIEKKKYRQTGIIYQLSVFSLTTMTLYYIYQLFFRIRLGNIFK